MRAAFVLVGFLCLVGCSDTCANTAHQTAMSPDGNSTAILFDRDCGATSGFSTQVSLVGIDEDPDGAGNVFVADQGDESAPWGGPWAELEWLARDQLLVRYDATARVFQQNGQVGDVQIYFEPVNR